MTSSAGVPKQEPTISVGIVDRIAAAEIRLEGSYAAPDSRLAGTGELKIRCSGGQLLCTGALDFQGSELNLQPTDPKACLFALEATIGIDFHWEQTETQSFRGGLTLLAQDDDRVTVVNRVPLETYITSVICSEMNADSPPDAIRSHAVISRSWLLAQLVARDAEIKSDCQSSQAEGEWIRWTEREAHAAFDVCADDHCQRYQGIGRTDVPDVASAIAETRGQVLMFNGLPCDARFSKSCGGVVEEFQSAWGDTPVDYLIAFADAADRSLPQPPLTGEQAMRQFIQHPPAAYCNCDDPAILGRVLNDYDQTTDDFYRWQVRLSAVQASELVQKKLGLNLGRLIAMEPVQRGPSGRLIKLLLTGEAGSRVIGKELEIRRALSPSHLYSSAFVIDTEGPVERPDTFVLSGAGWGHGVGLCQIGAAVMACQGIGYQDVLSHYYPGSTLQQLYH